MSVSQSGRSDGPEDARGGEGILYVCVCERERGDRNL